MMTLSRLLDMEKQLYLTYNTTLLYMIADAAEELDLNESAELHRAEAAIIGNPAFSQNEYLASLGYRMLAGGSTMRSICRACRLVLVSVSEEKIEVEYVESSDTKLFRQMAWRLIMPPWEQSRRSDFAKRFGEIRSNRVTYAPYKFSWDFSEGPPKLPQSPEF